ncbi:MAG: 8-oxo-dGTP diphosphatase [Gammaproteobacteria bacterium]
MKQSYVNLLYKSALFVAYRILLVCWFLFRPRRRGVFIAVWHNGRVLTIRNSYRHWIALPAGGLRKSEEPIKGAQRELREEVGIDLPENAFRAAGVFPTTFEFKRDSCFFFEVTLAVAPEIRVDQREVISADFMDPDEALRSVLAPPVRDYLDARNRSS